MKTKTMMSLGMMFLLSLAVTSAMSVSNVQTNYDKKTNQVNVEFDLTVKNECLIATPEIFNHKGDNVVKPMKPTYLISCIMQGDKVLLGAKTGTFHRSYNIDLIEKNEIKGLGNLILKISGSRGSVLFEDRV